MALIFSSGGGRLGNQILNLIHLIALSEEYNIKILKVNDSFLTSKDKAFMYSIDVKKVNWEINNYSIGDSFIYKILQKIFIRFLHIYFFISLKAKSYKIGSENNYPKFILGKQLKNGFSIKKLIKEAEISNVVISGWGLRDWELVNKNKKIIINHVTRGIKNFLKDKTYPRNDYLLVHIRRTDFLELSEYKDLNFNDEIWFKSILKLCQKKYINSVVIFSDSNISINLIKSLKDQDINVVIPESKGKSIFLKLFFSYISNANSVICNCSSLVLSASFLFHENVYLPSKQKDYQKVFIEDAHISYPSILNWN